jgi:membrane-associated phospholipid phosphatase
MMPGGKWGWLRIVTLSLALPAAVDSLDHAVQENLRRHHDPKVQVGMQAASDLAGAELLLGGMLAIAVLDPIAGPETARIAISSLLATGLVVEGIKFVVDRPRPHGWLRGWSSSFPSGHASGAFALAVIFTRRWKRLAIGFWTVAVTVALSRLYLERHYLSDVVAGAVIGFVSANAVARWPFARTWGLTP